MSPYLQAFEAYHRGGRVETPWSAALDFHLQTGIVHATPTAFVACRWVPEDADPMEICDLVNLAGKRATMLHVWTAAGDLSEILAFYPGHLQGSGLVSFQRGHKSPRLRKYLIRDLFERFP